jgi:hypothetical protein
MFTMGLVWTMSSLFGNFGRTFPFVFGIGGGGGDKWKTIHCKKGQEQKQQQQSTNICYHHFLI